METNTYTKLKDGSWGVRAAGKLTAGATITVTKKDGSNKSETIKTVLWSGTDQKTGKTISLCAISAGNGHSGGTSRGTCPDCGGHVTNPKYRYCYQCGLEHRDGGSKHNGGMSYYDRDGNFVLGDDD